MGEWAWSQARRAQLIWVFAGTILRVRSRSQVSAQGSSEVTSPRLKMYARSFLSLVLAVQVLALASCRPANATTPANAGFRSFVPVSRGCVEERWDSNVRENAKTRQNAESQQKMREEALADFGASVFDVVRHSVNAASSAANALSAVVAYIQWREP